LQLVEDREIWLLVELRGRGIIVEAVGTVVALDVETGADLDNVVAEMSSKTSLITSQLLKDEETATLGKDKIGRSAPGTIRAMTMATEAEAGVATMATVISHHR